MPIVNVANGILFASKLAETFESVEQIDIRCRFTGLNGRLLRPVLSAEPLQVALFQATQIMNSNQCHTAEVLLSENRVPLQKIKDDFPNLVHNLLKRLYEKFDFYELTPR